MLLMDVRSHMRRRGGVLLLELMLRLLLLLLVLHLRERRVLLLLLLLHRRQGRCSRGRGEAEGQVRGGVDARGAGRARAQDTTAVDADTAASRAPHPRDRCELGGDPNCPGGAVGLERRSGRPPTSATRVLRMQHRVRMMLLLLVLMHVFHRQRHGLPLACCLAVGAVARERPERA